jgi:hypothetical protein
MLWNKNSQGQWKAAKKQPKGAYLFPIGTEPTLLRVEITEVPPLQQRIVAETDARDHMTSTEGNLFCFGKELVHATI